MTVKELEQRVIALEQQVKKLQAERGSADNGRKFTWRDSFEKFKNDEHLLAALKEGMKLREQERRAVHKKRRPTRKSST